MRSRASGVACLDGIELKRWRTQDSRMPPLPRVSDHITSAIFDIGVSAMQAKRPALLLYEIDAMRDASPTRQPAIEL
jgi:hypothetical protein